MNKTYEGKTRYQDVAVADGYDNRRFVDWKGRWTDEREKRCLLRAFEKTGVTGGVLDLPCGTGRMTELLLSLGLDVTAADISDKMMTHARTKVEKYGSQVRFVTADIEKLHFEASSFELIVTIRLLHHIPQSLHAIVLSELHRVTKNYVIMTFSNKYALQNIRRNLVAKFTREPRYSISPSLFKQEVQAAGFRILDYMPLFPVLSEEVFVLLSKHDDQPEDT